MDYGREAEYYRMVVDGLAPEFEPASAWTFSRDKGGMIDEYIVDYEEYVGLGSGAMSYLGGRVYNNTFSLDDYRTRIEAGRTAVATAGKPYSRLGRMRYRFVTELFGLQLEMAFMKLAGGIAENSERWITLTPKGRYLLLVMMRETLATSNDHRDHARELLPAHEKVLLHDTEAFPCGPPPERFCAAK